MNALPFSTFLTPILIRLGRVLIGKNVASLARWAQTGLGTWLVTTGLMDPADAQDGITLGEAAMALGGSLLILESRINNWLRGHTLYGIDLSPAAALIGRGGLSLARAAIQVASAWLVTVGALDMEPAAVEAMPVDAVLVGVLGMASTRVLSWLEAWAKGELPEQVEARTLAEAHDFSVDGI